MYQQSALCIPDEIKREREFYRARGLPCPKDILPNAGEVEEEKANADAHAESDYHRTDEQVNAGVCSKGTLDSMFQSIEICRSMYVWNV